MRRCELIASLESSRHVPVDEGSQQVTVDRVEGVDVIGGGSSTGNVGGVRVYVDGEAGGRRVRHGRHQLRVDSILVRTQNK